MRLMSRALALLAALILLVAIGIVAFRITYSDRVFPAVMVGDVAVGGLDRDAAGARLEARANTLEGGFVTFTYADQRWRPSLAELGAGVDVEASLRDAYALGREPEALERLRATKSLLGGGPAVALAMRLDAKELNAWFDSVDAELDRPGRDAALVIDGAAVSIQPEEAGTRVDRPVAQAAIVNALANLNPFTAPLPVTDAIPAVRAVNLAAAQAQLQEAMKRPVTVGFEGELWTLDAIDLSQFVVQSTTPDEAGTGVKPVLDLDQEALAAWLSERFGPEIEREAVDAEIGWNEGPVAVSPSVEGITPRWDEFAVLVARSFLEKRIAVAIPVTVIPPVVDADNLAALGITTLLARGDSNYLGGTESRNINVEIGAGLLNGTLVPPHGEFSFNHAIGEITAERGYVESNVVVSERVGRDIGGGICQVSTTVFRAALLAGLPITEWYPHTYRIENYERDNWGPGFDASILQPEGDPFGGSDLRFENPTDSSMLVESWTTGEHVIVNIYGADLGYDVTLSDTQISEPIEVTGDLYVVNEDLPPGTIEQTEYPLPGYEVLFTREVFNTAGEQLYSRTFFTPFKGRGNVYQVSPDMN